MHDELWSAIIAAGTSVLVMVLSQILAGRREKGRAVSDEKDYLRKFYIEPIRFMLAENYYRVHEILREHERRKDLLFIEEPMQVLEKDEEWFTGEGCYLISSCYLTGCLFAYMQNIRDGMPFTKFSYYSDTKLLGLISVC